jgi:hypothetical protein
MNKRKENTQHKKGCGVAQVVDTCLANKCEVLGSNPSITKKESLYSCMLTISQYR